MKISIDIENVNIHCSIEEYEIMVRALHYYHDNKMDLDDFTISKLQQMAKVTKSIKITKGVQHTGVQHTGQMKGLPR